MGTLSVDKILKTSTGAAEFTLPATDGAAGNVWQTDGSGQISVAALAADTVTATQIAAGAVGTSEIAALAVTASEIAATTITPAKMANSAYLANRNTIINGDMSVSQRYGTASTAITVAGTNYFGVDRWKISYATGSGHTVQQVADVPVGSGLTYSLKTTIGTGASPTAAQQNVLYTPVEGNDWAQYSFGTASPATISWSFWVKSSLTGIFGVAIKSTNVDLHYVASYTISAANTWEKKTVEGIAGPTSGTWTGGTVIGAFVNFDLGSGTDFKKAAGAWAAGNADGVTSGTNLVATSSATWQVTGVQIEQSPTVTPFEHKTYAQELQACKRYFQIPYNWWAHSDAGTATAWKFFHTFPVEMRAAPTLAAVGTPTVNKMNANAAGPNSITTPGTANKNGFQLSFTTMATGSGSAAATNTPYQGFSGFTADAEL